MKTYNHLIVIDRILFALFVIFLVPKLELGKALALEALLPSLRPANPQLSATRATA